ncbi:MAG: AAA family ATPase [Rhodobacteraceae bacterium]|nr:AAA family ATPase [Paracoccaceae bacterium]
MALLKLKDRAMEAYAVARNAANFSLLDSDLHGVFGDNWESLNFAEAGELLGKGGLTGEEVLIVCVEANDETNLDPVDAYVRAAKRLNMSVVLVARDVSPTALHHLLQLGADDFAPYPLPPNALSNIFDNLRSKQIRHAAAPAKTKNRNGLILPVYGAAGGVGGSTFAVNLAWEMAVHTRKKDLKIALIDLDFQFGSVATLLDLPRRDAVFELLTEPDTLDGDTLSLSMTSFKSSMAVLSSPPEIMPLDIVDAKFMQKLLELLQQKFDFVVIDLPKALTDWTANVLNVAETYFTLLELDMRSAQNVMRYLRVLRAEDLPGEKIQYILNRAPGFTDLSGKTRIGRFSDSLGIEVNILLPEGGKAVTASGDQGVPLADSAPKNALRKEIKKIATTLVDMALEARATVN